MTDDAVPPPLIETPRLLLRPWRIDEAAVLHTLWGERDPRVPPHRRLTSDGHPTLAELEASIRDDTGSPSSKRSLGLPAIELRDTGDVIGYAGLTDGRTCADEPELAYELLRRQWGHGYATEAATAVVDWAARSGYRRLWATVWDWNTASRRVLAKLGFTETEHSVADPERGITLYTTKAL